eukprot:975446-Prorocentrum_minimum.AAC.1
MAGSPFISIGWMRITLMHSWGFHGCSGVGVGVRAERSGDAEAEAGVAAMVGRATIVIPNARPRGGPARQRGGPARQRG